MASAVSLGVFGGGSGSSGRGGIATVGRGATGASVCRSGVLEVGRGASPAPSAPRARMPTTQPAIRAPGLPRLLLLIETPSRGWGGPCIGATASRRPRPIFSVALSFLDRPVGTLESGWRAERNFMKRAPGSPRPVEAPPLREPGPLLPPAGRADRPWAR